MLSSIGAFPLRPSTTKIDEDGNLYVDSTSSEYVLYEQIKAWLEESDRKAGLLERVIPQKGLAYEKDAVANDWKARYYLERYPDADVLVGCYHNQAHLDWIQEQGMYNIRLGSKREGAIPREDLEKLNVRFIILYQEGKEDENDVIVYRVNGTKEMRPSDMIKAGYPGNPQYSYECYLVDEEVDIGKYDIFHIVLWARTDRNYKEYAPVFLRCSEMIAYRR